MPFRPAPVHLTTSRTDNTSPPHTAVHHLGILFPFQLLCDGKLLMRVVTLRPTTPSRLQQSAVGEIFTKLKFGVAYYSTPAYFRDCTKPIIMSLPSETWPSQHQSDIHR
ncbi:hypothetical protein DAPPUDRAFT_241972 [Daphnia pulex]|uniref:Uncharacterized protein n=1 Tax=Daphnia pulex TaxID=6669 RepID=E9GFI7_DAPPU|nr:hypothetical protein DAPPUDRAFT_241972 [Daphnia pulex]|eukprot:EFX81803.1 hypothetical protein DAPPUDRAFT_241972 [Daphnia pulex]